MAWRIDEAVIRGEIDNRVRGRVTGRIWFAGRDEPVELELAGNCWRDLAGRRLEFTQAEPKPMDLDGLAPRQNGTVGDITASRKVKVPEFPLSQLAEYYKTGKKWTWHWGNSLYLEWFSDRNGRVVIESASYDLKIVGDAAWEMTPAEEEQQRRVNGEAMGGFTRRLGEAIIADRKRKGEPVDDTPPEWNAEPDLETSEREDDDVSEEALAPAEDRPRHPLVERAVESQFRFRREAEERGWMPPGASDEHPVADAVLSLRDAARKFAGALNSHRTWPPDPRFRDHVIERLERARGYLDRALLAAAYCEDQKLADLTWLAGVQREMHALIHECNKLLAGLRAPPADANGPGEG